MSEDHTENPTPMDLPAGNHEAITNESVSPDVAHTELSASKLVETSQSDGPFPGLTGANPLIAQTDDGQSTSQATTQAPIATPHIADDVDLIEKEWVEKAKEIVDSTREDPFRQNEQITKVKAEYLRKRYQKDIKSNVE